MLYAERVCRGKLSEGIDFRDSKGRVIIVTGNRAAMLRIDALCYLSICLSLSLPLSASLSLSLFLSFCL